MTAEALRGQKVSFSINNSTTRRESKKNFNDRGKGRKMRAGTQLTLVLVRLVFMVAAC